jgi:hypothetical protein
MVLPHPRPFSTREEGEKCFFDLIPIPSPQVEKGEKCSTFIIDVV